MGYEGLGVGSGFKQLARRGTGGPMDVGSEVLEVDTEVLVAHMGSMEVGSRFKEWELRS